MLSTSHSSRSNLLRRFAVPLPARLRRDTRPGPDQDGYAVRVDWPGVGGRPPSHDFSRFTLDLLRVARRAEATRRYWAPGPLRPLAVTVAPISRAVFAAHRSACTSPDCPTTAPLLGMTAGGERACVQQG